MVKIKEYIESGVLEMYVFGSASEEETKELLKLKKQYPEIQEALWNLELDLERISQQMAIIPPPGTFEKIEAGINSLIKTPRPDDLIIEEIIIGNRPASDNNQMMEVQAAPSYMRILKIWGWVFAAIFLLGVIFLAIAVYFYQKNSHTKQEIELLKTKLKNERTH